MVEVVTVFTVDRIDTGFAGFYFLSRVLEIELKTRCFLQFIKFKESIALQTQDWISEPNLPP